MVEILTRCAYDKTRVNTAEMKNVTRVTLKEGIVANSHLERYFYRAMPYYSPIQDYTSQAYILRKEFDAIVNKIDTTITFSPGARNLINHLLDSFFRDMCIHADRFIQSAKTKTLSPRTMDFALLDLLSGSLLKTIQTKTNRAVRNTFKFIKKTDGEGDSCGEGDGDEGDEGDEGNEDDGEDGEDGKEEEEGEEDEEQPPAKKPSKKAANLKAKQITEDEEDEDELDDLEEDLEEEEGEEELEDEPVAPPPKKKQTAGKKNNKKGNKKNTKNAKNKKTATK
jgi:hypothetical protein